MNKPPLGREQKHRSTCHMYAGSRARTDSKRLAGAHDRQALPKYPVNGKIFEEPRIPRRTRQRRAAYHGSLRPDPARCLLGSTPSVGGPTSGFDESYSLNPSRLSAPCPRLLAAPEHAALWAGLASRVNLIVCGISLRTDQFSFTALLSVAAAERHASRRRWLRTWCHEARTLDYLGSWSTAPSTEVPPDPTSLDGERGSGIFLSSNPNQII